MKVLHLGAGNLYGGIETYFVTLARLRHLAPEMEPEYGLCFHGRLWDELTATGVPVHDLGQVRLSRPWTVLRARRRLQTVIAERMPDVVVIHSGWVHLVFAPVIRNGGIRLVFYAHNPPDRSNRIDRWAARTRPDLVIANSRFTAESVSVIFPAVPTTLTYYPVQVELPPDRAGVREAVRAEVNTPDTAVVVVTACRLEWWKGHTLLLDSLGMLRDQPDWMTWVAGGAQRPAEVAYLNELKGMAEKRGIADRVKFLGQRSDVPRLLVAADIHCQPNTGPEPFGIAFIEALAAGLPVVTTAMGGALEIADETCGVLVPVLDADALATTLRHLIIDMNHRRLLGTNGPSRASALCDPAQAIQKLSAVLREERV